MFSCWRREKEGSGSESNETSNTESEEYIKIEGDISDYAGLQFKIDQGRRLYQEDRASIAKFDDGREIYCVFDGHGGKDVSDLAKTEVIQLLKERSDLDTSQAIMETFQVFGKSVRQINAGSTAVVSVLDREKQTISVGNVGDSFCLLIKENGDVEQITEDHNTGMFNRLEPIRGGSRGSINMYQSFGDSRYDVTYGGYHKTASLDDVEYIVIASDGLSHKLTNEEIAEISIKSKNPAKLLVDDVLSKGGNDNITVLSINLKNYRETESSSFFSYSSYDE